MHEEAKKRLEEQLKKETGGGNAPEYDKVVRAAFDAMKNAYAPYSGFKVGAALLGRNGKIYLGCNVENASYSLTCCAERVAFYNAIADGCKSFKSIAIVGGKDGDAEEYCPPCGACRQLMTEFCSPDFKVVLSKNNEGVKVYRLGDLLPNAFRL